MIKDFRKTKNLKKLKMVSLVFFDILQLPHTVISNSEKLTHPIVHQVVILRFMAAVLCCATDCDTVLYSSCILM